MTFAPGAVSVIAGANDLETYIKSIGGPSLCTSLTKLSGGYINLTCRSTRSDGTTVIIKHAKTISKPGWPTQLLATRAYNEQEMLKLISLELSPTKYAKDYLQIEIGTPKGLGYFPEHHVQVIEDFPDTVDLETLILEIEMDEKMAYAIGEALGVWTDFACPSLLAKMPFTSVTLRRKFTTFIAPLTRG